MSIFSQNIKMLRKRKQFTQDEVAQSLTMKRSTLSGYENEVAHPNMQVLVAFSDYFNVSIDTLIKVELSKLTESQINQLERGYDVFIKGSKLRVLTTTVGDDNEENIELVAEKAKAGYTSGFADPEYIKVLPTFRLPFLSKQKKYRTFQISGDSMLPIPDGAYVTGEYVQNWNTIKDKGAYIILTLDDGIVFKVIENKIKKENKFRLHSLNSIYEPYDLLVTEIREVWRFVNYISSEIPEANEMRQDIVQSIDSLRREVKQMQIKLNL
ncbi:MAG: LexA family transcriptional regulator [Bacteroidales bacterium]|nr:LexA family transcriptional regulator [Bacteroidales bacterium]